MKNVRVIYFLFFFAYITSLLVACNSISHIAATLDNVESYINERPDSALAVLQRVDSTALTTRALRARYSLLRVMALDKCYKDITVHGLLNPAVAWYEHHGTADERMKVLFYQGRIAQENKDWKSSAVYYSRAEDYSKRANDTHAVGLLFEAISSIYNAVYNTGKEQEYVEKALSVYKRAHDPIYSSALGDLALVFHTRQDWAKADSLYQEAISQSENYPHSMSIYLSNYARMKVIQPDKDPVGALGLLDRKQSLSGSLTVQEAGVYAYALVLSGKEKQAKDLLIRLEQYAASSPEAVETWRSRCAVAMGDYEQAYKSLNRARLWEESEVRNLLSDSVSSAISDNREMAAKQKQVQYRIRIAVMAIILLLMSFALVLAHLRKNKVEADKSRLLEVCSVLEKEAEEQETRTAQLKQQLNHFQEIARQERVSRFRQAGRLRTAIWRLDRRGVPAWFSEDADMLAIKEELSQIYDIDGSGEKLIRRLDRELDGAITSLLVKLNLQEKPQEQLFLCCCLLNLPSDVVAARFGITANNVRVKKHRLKDQIAAFYDADYDALFDIHR